MTLPPPIYAIVSGRRRDLDAETIRKYRDKYERLGYTLPEPALPSALRVARNGTRAIARNVKNLGRQAPADVRSQRIAICETCPASMFRESDRRCAHPDCGCFIDVKVLLAAESCPLGHWAAVEVPQRKKRAAADRAGRNGIGRALQYRSSVHHEFVTTDRLWIDAKVLLGKIPSDVVAIAGIARSGLNVATLLAMLLHLPLYIVRQNLRDIVEAGSGWRSSGKNAAKLSPGRVLVVDDCCMTGGSLTKVLPVAKKRWKRIITATVYCNPAAKVKPDLFARELPWPMLMEWNLFNGVLSTNVATDFDGVLCEDFCADIDTAKPLYLPRRVAVPLIVTARHERSRQRTEAWLKRHGVLWTSLEMRPDTGTISAVEHKAKHFSAWARRTVARPAPLMFIESSDDQAQAIADRTRRLVVCPTTATCYLRR